LEAILEALKDEINILHSKDTPSGTFSTTFFQNLLEFLGNVQIEIQMLESVTTIIKKRMQRLAMREQFDSPHSVSKIPKFLHFVFRHFTSIQACQRILSNYP
jgi:hypothetical protein